MKRYLIEYLLKGLDSDVQKEIFQNLYNKFTFLDRRYIADSANNFENLKNTIQFKDNPKKLTDILTRYEEIFINTNEILDKNQRYPFFENPKDLVKSLRIYDSLFTFIEDEDCKNVLGCESFESYMPRTKK